MTPRIVVLLALVASCASPGRAEPVVSAEVFADAKEGTEAYVCVPIELSTHGRAIAAIRWAVPPGHLAWHHATLYGAPRSVALPADCIEMPPSAHSIHVWFNGGDDLVLPEGVGLRLPADAERLFVQAHVMRTGPSEARPATVSVTLRDAPTEEARWIGVGASVPAIRPRMTETSGTRCRFSASGRMIFAWPHMHRVGVRATVELLRGATRETVVDVAPFAFDAQRTYPVSAAVDPASVLELTCTWRNPGDEYVLPGVKTTDEMCTLGMVVTGAVDAACD